MVDRRVRLGLSPWLMSLTMLAVSALAIWTFGETGGDEA